MPSVSDSAVAPAFVMLRNGPAVRVEAVDLLLDLERRGVRLTVDNGDLLLHAPAQHVTDEDRAAIRQHKVHLPALIDYCEREVCQ